MTREEMDKMFEEFWKENAPSDEITTLDPVMVCKMMANVAFFAGMVQGADQVDNKLNV